MSFNIIYCVECENEGVKNLYVVNKTHKLCAKHNKQRIGKVSPRVIITPTKSKLEKKKEEFYQRYDSEVEHICTGCLNKNNLSHSHLIPVSRRKELECSKSNVKFHCLLRIDGSEGCHSRWESNNEEKMKSLLDYEENMEYLKMVDLPYYNFIISKYE